MITLIDTGIAGCEMQIFENIRSAGRDPSKISLIILTHSHPDHIGAAGAIRQATKCSVAAHTAERAWVEDVALQNRERPVPGFTTLVGGSVRIDHELVEGETIEPDGTRAGEMLVLHTPGHSKGSISLFLHREGTLFSGDAVPVAGELPVYDDAAESVNSVKRLRRTAGIRCLLSSWDQPRMGNDAYRQMDRAIDYLKTIQKTVLVFFGDGTTDLMELTRITASALGLPPDAVNPLLSRTITATLQTREQTNL
jgi:flavorubredoxin